MKDIIPIRHICVANSRRDLIRRSGASKSMSCLLGCTTHIGNTWTSKLRSKIRRIGNMVPTFVHSILGLQTCWTARVQAILGTADKTVRASPLSLSVKGRLNAKNKPECCHQSKVVGPLCSSTYTPTRWPYNELYASLPEDFQCKATLFRHLLIPHKTYKPLIILLSPIILTIP